MRLTNWGEAAAFLLARAIIVALLFFVTPALFAPVYMRSVHLGGPALLMAVTMGVSLLMWLVTLLLFLLFRAGFGAVPAIVDPRNRTGAFISSGGEIGAFVLSVVLVTVVLTALNSWMLAGLYASLRKSGHVAAMQGVALAVSATVIVVFFALFIALRAALSPPAPAPHAGG